MTCLHCPAPGPIKRPIKMGCTELCGDVDTKQRHMPRQIRIEFCANLSVSLSVSVSASVSVSGSVNAPSHIS